MRKKRISKTPGYSLINMDQVVHKFVSGDSSNPQSAEIKTFLVSIIKASRDEGYTTNTSNVLHDIEEEDKEQSLGYHSEKLAVAFALLRFKDSSPIRVMKNLRICHDCHSFMKHVSNKFDREIIIRDRNRFHHFIKGSCSCRDYWWMTVCHCHWVYLIIPWMEDYQWVNQHCFKFQFQWISSLVDGNYRRKLDFHESRDWVSHSIDYKFTLDFVSI